MPDLGAEVILDTGPLVALLDAGDQHHPWASSTLSGIEGGIWTCEAVVTEAIYLLRRHRPAQDKVLEWIERGELICGFLLPGEIRAVRALWQRYAGVPMSLADACLVRMAELHPRAAVCTLDSDFTVYRKAMRTPINLLSPVR